MRPTGHVYAVAATAVGLLPGMVLPFVLAASLPRGESDTVLLALGINQFLVNVIFAGVEANAVASFGASPLKADGLSWRQVASFSRRSLVPSCRWTAIAGSALVILTAWRLEDRSAFIAASLVLLVNPIIGTLSSTLAGVLISRKDSPYAIGSQGFRSVLPMIAVVTGYASSVVTIAALYLAGEALRTLFLLWVVGRRAVTGQGSGEPDPRPRGLDWQYATSALTQTNPPIDRLFLAGATGSVTAYELADKIAFVVFQAVYNVGILGRLHAWTRGTDAESTDRYRTFVRDSKLLFSTTVVLGLLTGGVVFGALLWLPVPEEWRLGLIWSLVALCSIPFAVLVTASMRFCVILGVQRQMTAVSVVGFCSNMVANLVLYLTLGPVGVVVATIVTRAVIALLLVRLIRRSVLDGL